jgi:hypothetical protein
VAPGFEVETYCPFLPPGSIRQIPGKLIETLFDLNQDKQSKPVFQRAMAAYIYRVDRANFVRFRDHLEKEIAVEFVDCMSRLGIFRGSLECVSGDPDKKSEDRKQWKGVLHIRIKPRPSGGDFGSKSSLSVRPAPQLNPNTNVKRSAFRFLLVMAYIAFGEILDPQMR